ncbi:FitA-like ribbon-helix-helix domain-containing protein [Oryzibacter oryziterrae]|uniref:FitA-like ribbon-helix-helix domain-containing protein n=1 Tax=Oryzibacter oryziterrae TaxID=2766474 RepID=UPI001F48E834|nr:hypothetical protein [Oryzibacter oryziterrae]
MSALTISSLDPETLAGLNRLAATHGRSLEAEVVSILRGAAVREDDAILSDPELGLGSKIHALFVRHGGLDLPEREPWPEGDPKDFRGPEPDR